MKFPLSLKDRLQRWCAGISNCLAASDPATTLAVFHGPGTGLFSRRIQERCLVLLGGCPAWFPGKCACPPLLARERLPCQKGASPAS